MSLRMVAVELLQQHSYSVQASGTAAVLEAWQLYGGSVASCIQLGEWVGA
jgi:hypothetical protein